MKIGDLSMKHRTLSPGQPGTKKLLEKYGEKLLFVRYRYDAEKKQKLKTVEIIIQRQDWEPDSKKIPQNKIMHLRIDYGEIELARMVKSLGGRWNRKKKVWELPYRQVNILGLENRIVNQT